MVLTTEIIPHVCRPPPYRAGHDQNNFEDSAVQKTDMAGLGQPEHVCVLGGAEAR